jgi:hypothetical protein
VIFGAGFDPKNNRIWNALQKSYRLELTSDLSLAELLIYGDFGTSHWNYTGKKVYLTGENMLPDFNQCDLAFTPAEIINDDRAIRLPLYAQIIQDPHSLIRPAGYDASQYLMKEKFCSFVVSNPVCSMRNRVFKKINSVKRVDSGGAHFNNIGIKIKDKLAFIKNYRFNIACENSSSPGYITEKLIDPIMVGTIPIYWGDPEIERDFHKGCLINVSDYKNLDELVEWIIF